MSSPSRLTSIRPIVFAAGLRGKLFEQIAILFQMEILGHAVFAAERDHVASQFLLAARGGDFGHVGARLSGVPVGRVHALLQRIGMQIHALRAAIGSDDAGLDWRVAGGQISWCREPPRANARGRHRTARGE